MEEIFLDLPMAIALTQAMSAFKVKSCIGVLTLLLLSYSGTEHMQILLQAQAGNLASWRSGEECWQLNLPDALFSMTDGPSNADFACLQGHQPLKTREANNNATVSKLQGIDKLLK